MFYLLLVVTLVLALAVSHIVVKLFDEPINSILNRVIKDDISGGWAKYLKFAIYVVGVSGGVRIYDLERYISSNVKGQDPLVLTTQRWVLEIYRTIIESLESIAWMLLVFFIFALIAYVVVRIFEMKKGVNHRDLNDGSESTE